MSLLEIGVATLLAIPIGAIGIVIFAYIIDCIVNVKNGITESWLTLLAYIWFTAAFTLIITGMNNNG